MYCAKLKRRQLKEIQINYFNAFSLYNHKDNITKFLTKNFIL